MSYYIIIKMKNKNLLDKHCAMIMVWSVYLLALIF